MTKLRFFVVLAIAASTGCQSSHVKDANKLSCILLGNDSVAWYYGSSAQMAGLKKGKITDSIFMQKFIRFARQRMKDSAFVIVVKPTAANDVPPNMETMIDWLNNNDLQSREMSNLDENEQRKFNTLSWQSELAKSKEFHLSLPRDSQSPHIKVPAKDLLVLLFNEHGIYEYPGDDMSSGKTYAYSDLKEFLATQKSNPRLTILLKPSAGATYKNTVNVLDVVQQAGIKTYALVDITPAEEEYLKKRQQALSS